MRAKYFARASLVFRQQMSAILSFCIFQTVVSPNGKSREFICAMTSPKHKNDCRFLLLTRIEETRVEESPSTRSTGANLNSVLDKQIHKSLF